MSCLFHMNGMNNVEGTQDQEHQDRHIGFWVLINMDRADLRVRETPGHRLGTSKQ